MARGSFQSVRFFAILFSMVAMTLTSSSSSASSPWWQSPSSPSSAPSPRSFFLERPRAAVVREPFFGDRHGCQPGWPAGPRLARQFQDSGRCIVFHSQHRAGDPFGERAARRRRSSCSGRSAGLCFQGEGFGQDAAIPSAVATAVEWFARQSAAVEWFARQSAAK